MAASDPQYQPIQQIQPPPSLALREGNVAENFKAWKRQMKIFLLASGGSSLPKQQQTALLLHCAGPEAMDVYEHFSFTAEADKEDPEKVMEKFEAYCSPRETEALHIIRFWHHPTAATMLRENV